MSYCVEALNEWHRQQREALAKEAALKEARDKRRYGDNADEGWRTFSTDGTCWPKQSYALGVHPSQIDEEIAQAKAQGIDIDFVREGPDAGDAILPSRKMRKKYSRAKKLHDKDGGYGDA